MLSEDQKSRVRHYLGYADLFRFAHTRLEGVLSALNSPLTLDAEARIIDALNGLVLVEARLGKFLGMAGIKRVDDVEFFKSSVYSEITRLGRMYVNRISIATGVPIANDIFSTHGYAGDAYSGNGGLGGGGGRGMIPLG